MHTSVVPNFHIWIDISPVGCAYTYLGEDLAASYEQQPACYLSAGEQHASHQGTVMSPLLL